MTPIIPLLCLALMTYSIAQSRRKLRTIIYGVLAIAGTLGVIVGLIAVFSLNEVIMAHVAAITIFIIPAYVMRTHSQSTKKLVSRTLSTPPV